MGDAIAPVKHPTEAGHWYTRDGQPAYEVPRARGDGMRPTTLRDARKLGLVPSVTSILNVAAKPGLQKWLINQHLLAAATLPQGEGEPADDWIARVIVDAETHAREARERGTDIHRVLQAWYGDERGALTDDELRIGEAVGEALEAHVGLVPWDPEVSFATQVPGSGWYGGKADLVSPEAGVVVDFKGTETLQKPKLAWPEHEMQLAAYAHGLLDGCPAPRMINVFFERENPTAIHVHEWERDGGSAWDRFKCLLRYWHLERGLL